MSERFQRRNRFSVAGLIAIMMGGLAIALALAVAIVIIIHGGVVV